MTKTPGNNFSSSVQEQRREKKNLNRKDNRTKTKLKKKLMSLF